MTAPATFTEAPFTRAQAQARGVLRSSQERYECVKAYCPTEEMVRLHLPLERARDANLMSQDLHAQLVPVTPTRAVGIYRAFDFAAADRGRRTSLRIAEACEQARLDMAAADEAFLASLREEPDHFGTPRVAGRVA